MSGTRERADRLARLHAVQIRRRQIEEWRVAALKDRQKILSDETRDILQALSEGSMMQDLFLEAKASALRRKESERQEVSIRLLEASRRLQDAAGIEKRLGRVERDAWAEEAVQNERDELARTLDAFVAARASLK